MTQASVHYLGATPSSWVALAQNYQRAVPKPENRVAAALVDGFSFAYGGDDAAFAKFKGTGGKLDRLAWAAAGYRKPGDKFHGPTDVKWWSRPFDRPSELYGVLLAWAQALDAAQVKRGDAAGPRTDELAQWDPALAAGEQGALANYLGRHWEGLKLARAAGVEPVGPKLPGLKPMPGPKLPDKPVPVPVPTLPTVGVPSWVRIALVVGLLYLITKER